LGQNQGREVGSTDDDREKTATGFYSATGISLVGIGRHDMTRYVDMYYV
jgi:hypothetical protein